LMGVKLSKQAILDAILFCCPPESEVHGESVPCGNKNHRNLPSRSSGYEDKQEVRGVAVFDAETRAILNMVGLDPICELFHYHYRCNIPDSTVSRLAEMMMKVYPFLMASRVGTPYEVANYGYNREDDRICDVAFAFILAARIRNMYACIE